eukprot:CAMPEP_0194583690 /NCGR_PEP_ID=MMETSP0292-20121207/16523_1 /TAXON_ID=39354 /ORGANISM="Heterosigma akashiwo, Strain CCMP2393" /LENGTH=209 /DNA_ID=CAMNT_0039438427 /DNA_START=1 /DNA_END=631 /DNA_ORIENTATION=+
MKMELDTKEKGKLSLCLEYASENVQALPGYPAAALISSSYAFVQHNTLTANVKSSSSMKMELDTKEKGKLSLCLWKGMYAEGKMFKHFLAILLLALISSSYAFVQHNTLTANVKSSSSMKMELDTKELFKKNVQMWKGMYAEGGMRAFADSFADDGKLFLKVDTEHELTGPAEILNFMQDWKVAYDIQDIQFSEPACSKTAFACTWSAR